MEQEKARKLGKAQYEFKKEFRMKKTSHMIISGMFAVVSIVVAALLMMAFVFGIYHVSGNGMESTAKEGSYAIGNKLAYQVRDPARGDIIVSGGNIYRVIGLPGEHLEIYGGHVYVNGNILSESYVSGYTYPLNENEVFTIPDDSYFVLCDNRYCYNDSRSGFAIKRDAIMSKIFMVI